MVGPDTGSGFQKLLYLSEFEVNMMKTDPFGRDGGQGLNTESGQTN